jgi:hypothetical protein
VEASVALGLNLLGVNTETTDRMVDVLRSGDIESESDVGRDGSWR